MIEESNQSLIKQRWELSLSTQLHLCRWEGPGCVHCPLNQVRVVRIFPELHAGVLQPSNPDLLLRLLETLQFFPLCLRPSLALLWLRTPHTQTMLFILHLRDDKVKTIVWWGTYHSGDCSAYHITSSQPLVLQHRALQLLRKWHLGTQSLGKPTHHTRSDARAQKSLTGCPKHSVKMSDIIRVPTWQWECCLPLCGHRLTTQDPSTQCWSSAAIFSFEYIVFALLPNCIQGKLSIRVYALEMSCRSAWLLVQLAIRRQRCWGGKGSLKLFTITCISGTW